MDKIMNKGINVLSLFDGISCGQIALQRAGIKVNKYYASEIDKHAIKITQHNWPNTIQLGSVVDIKAVDLPKIDLLMGGSPCTNFSFAGKRNGMSTVDKQEILTLGHYLDLKSKGYEFEGQSYLFWEYIRILKEVKPKCFLLENVKMPGKWKDLISDVLEVEPIEINSALVSAQNRHRLYWTSIPNVSKPNDKKILLKDILDYNVENYRFYTEDQMKKWNEKKYIRKDYYRIESLDGKVQCLMAQCGSNAPRILVNKKLRYLTRMEWERLQTVPDGYTNLVSEHQAKHALGNGWTVDVIAHIFSFLPDEFKNNG